MPTTIVSPFPEPSNWIRWVEGSASRATARSTSSSFEFDESERDIETKDHVPRASAIRPAIAATDARRTPELRRLARAGGWSRDTSPSAELLRGGATETIGARTPEIDSVEGVDSIVGSIASTCEAGRASKGRVGPAVVAAAGLGLGGVGFGDAERGNSRSSAARRSLGSRRGDRRRTTTAPTQASVSDTMIHHDRLDKTALFLPGATRTVRTLGDVQNTTLLSLLAPLLGDGG